MPNGPVFECHLNTGQMDTILFSYVSFWYIEHNLIKTNHLKSELPKSLVFKCFWYSSGLFSDPQCIKMSVLQIRRLQIPTVGWRIPTLRRRRRSLRPKIIWVTLTLHLVRTRRRSTRSWPSCGTTQSSACRTRKDKNISFRKIPVFKTRGMWPINANPSICYSFTRVKT